MKALQYEMGDKPLVNDKWVAKMTKDINKLGTWPIVCFLLKRHQVSLLWAGLSISLVLIVMGA